MNFVKERKSFFAIYRRFSHIFYTLAACIALILLVGVLDNTLDLSLLIIKNNLFHRIFEVFILIISFSIFFVTYYTYPQTKDFRLLIIGYIFLAGGLLYCFKILDIIDHLTLYTNSKQNHYASFLLCIIIRFINSVCFSVLLTHKFKDKAGTKRRYPFLTVVVFLIVSFLLVGNSSVINLFFTPEGGLTIISIIVILFDCLLYLYIFCRMLIHSRQKNDFVNKTVTVGFLIMLFSEMTLLSIERIYDLRAVLSQFLLTASYGVLFYSFYIGSVRRPYILLSKANEKRESNLIKLDKLVESRTKELRDMYEKLMADKELARGIQISMLPRELPKDDYIAFSAGYLPAEELSGDFYNVFKIDDTRYGICIGDVSGHGVSAAMLSIFAFQKMQSLMEETDGGGMAIPSTVLQHMYESFNGSNFNDDMYFVMFYGVFNTQTGILSYASGGLNTIPLRIRPDGLIQELDNDGFAICKLGSFLKPKFVNYQILLFPGDKLVLYTDGLVDAKNLLSEGYSLSRLKSVIADYSKYGIDYLSEAIMKDVIEFTNQKPMDDITLLIMDCLPPF